MGRTPDRKKNRWIVFGTQDVGDKSLLAYKDKSSGMYAVKIAQNTADCSYEFGEKADVSPAAIEKEIEGEYTTLLFSGKNGIKSIDVFIETLQQLRITIETDAVNILLSTAVSDAAKDAATEEEVSRAEKILEYVEEKRRSRPASLTDIYIRDKVSGVIRRVGENRHDMLTISEDGELHYHHLQNGDGCSTGRRWHDQDYGYEFVPNLDPYGYSCDPRDEAIIADDRGYNHAKEEITLIGENAPDIPDSKTQSTV